MAATKMTKTQFMQAMAERAGLDKRQVNAVFDALSGLIKDQLGPSGPGELTILNLVKLKVKITEAKPETEGVDPFTKEKKIFKAKPASRKVRATPMTGLKDLVNNG